MIVSGHLLVAGYHGGRTGQRRASLVTGLDRLLTVPPRLLYGGSAALFPHAGGSTFICAKHNSPLWGFLYGWRFSW